MIRFCHFSFSTKHRRIARAATRCVGVTFRPVSISCYTSS